MPRPLWGLCLGPSSYSMTLLIIYRPVVAVSIVSGVVEKGKDRIEIFPHVIAGKIRSNPLNPFTAP